MPTQCCKMKRRYCKGLSVEEAAWHDRNTESQVAVLLAWHEIVAGRTTDSLQAAQFCSDVFLHVSPGGKVHMSGIRASHEAELADRWLAHNSNDLVHFLMPRFLGQGWPRISPSLTSNQGKDHCWKLMGYSATLERNLWYDPTQGCNFLVVQKIIMIKIKVILYSKWLSSSEDFLYLSLLLQGRQNLVFVPMTDKEPLAASLVLAWSSLVSSTVMFPKQSPRQSIRSSAQLLRWLSILNIYKLVLCLFNWYNSKTQDTHFTTVDACVIFR